MCALIVKDGRILSFGLNGTPSKTINCSEKFPNKTSKKFDREKHHHWSTAFEIHAELNATSWANKIPVSVAGGTMYITSQPCSQCLKYLVAVGITRIVYSELYDKADWHEDTLQFLKRSKVQIFYCPLKD